MDSLFIEPGSLPGGRAWKEACENVIRQQAINATSTSAVSEALHCDVSPNSGLVQVLLLLVVYGGILFKASQLIALGSELLLLVPSLRHIVGSVVLPILGAVPDGAIVLFSGLGPNAQEELSVGVGALAGSTSMLLTLPWFLSVLAGRVNIRADGVPTYHQKPHKLHPSGNMHLTRTGVGPLKMVSISGKIMLLTSVSYLVIQAAALRTGHFFRAEQTKAVTKAAAASEKVPAIFCFVVCAAFFIWYLHYQVTSSSSQDEYREYFVDEIKQKAIRDGQISLTAAFQEIWTAAQDADETTGLTVQQHKKERLGSLLKTFFNAYDDNNSRTIERYELQNLMRDLGEKCSPDEIAVLYEKMDKNSDGLIELEEFIENMPEFIVSRAQHHVGTPPASPDAVDEARRSNPDFDAELDAEEEEEEEVPLDLKHQDPDTQIRNIMKRSFLMMTIGTVLVLIFSDPIVGVMSDIGQRIGVPAFYVSFVLAPLASNASELLAAYSYALKKTRKTVTISFSTLLGAAIMNNTFVLSIFMMLISIKGLAWQFTAETISILVVELALGFMSQKKILTLRDGYFVLALFPFSIFLVFFLENVVGLD